MYKHIQDEKILSLYRELYQTKKTKKIKPWTKYHLDFRASNERLKRYRAG
jgi:hypothetical protein